MLSSFCTSPSWRLNQNAYISTSYIKWWGVIGAAEMQFFAFRMHQFKCFTSNINRLSNPVFVSTGTNGLPNGLPFKNLLVMERTFVILHLIILPIIINHLNVTLLMSSYPMHVPPYPWRIYIHHLCDRLGHLNVNLLMALLDSYREWNYSMYPVRVWQVKWVRGSL